MDTRYLDENFLDGWMAKDELEWLSYQASLMESVVELGVYKGKSVCAMADVCEGTVYAVDHWKGSWELKMKGDEYEEFKRNIKPFKNIKIIKKDSIKAAKYVDKVDMVFIDADHSYEAVKKDIQTWMPKTKRLICGHDYSGETKRAVDELIEIDGTAHSIWYKYI